MGRCAALIPDLSTGTTSGSEAEERSSAARGRRAAPVGRPRPRRTSRTRLALVSTQLRRNSERSPYTTRPESLHAQARSPSPRHGPVPRAGRRRRRPLPAPEIRAAGPRDPGPHGCNGRPGRLRCDAGLRFRLAPGGPSWRRGAGRLGQLRLRGRVRRAAAAPRTERATLPARSPQPPDAPLPGHLLPQRYPPSEPHCFQQALARSWLSAEPNRSRDVSPGQGGQSRPADIHGEFR